MRLSMSAKNNQKELLSSWKEISAYLKCSVRTCVRWENEFGLPVHRMENKPKSSVFAYRHELDEWLEKKLNSNAKLRKEKHRRSVFRITLFILVPILLVVGTYFVTTTFFLPSKEPSPQKKPASSGVPQSTGPLTLNDNDIVTAEFGRGGKLRVWRNEGARSYREVWRIEPVRHTSFAVGNIDQEDDCEIVAPAMCMEIKERGERKESHCKYFLNVYKQGEKDWWQTTFYSDKNCVFEDKWFELNEVTIGNVDGLPGNEIILITKSCLAVFQYDVVNDELELLRSRYSFFEDIPLILKSVTVGNIDSDEAEEIVVVADEKEGEGTAVGKGWLLIFKFKERWPQLIQSIQVDVNFAFHSLRLGDVIPGGKPEIIAGAYTSNTELLNSVILGWDSEGKKIFETPIYEKENPAYRIIHLDVGNLTPDGGDDIVVIHPVPDELIRYYWDGSKLVEGSRMSIGIQAAMAKVFVQDSNHEYDSPVGVIVCGSTAFDSGLGRFYFEVFDYNREFLASWRRLGAEKEDLRVYYAGFGKRRE
jgi:hypothetical protein